MTDADETPREITHTEPSNGTPPALTDAASIAEALRDLQSGSGPIAVDAERASGFRYSQRAYLLQFARTSIHLIDPTTSASLSEFITYVNSQSWILHAATQDLPCLRELGFIPTDVFDTELAAKLLGRPKVGLGALLESEMNVVIAKEHSAVDWSTRPLPEAWRAYAALDVEFLVELHAQLLAELTERGRAPWYEQERALLLDFAGPTPRPEAWRRTSGIHAIRDPRKQAIVRALWLARDLRAQELDISSGRVLHDSVIVDVAKHAPKSQTEMVALRPIHSRNVRKDPDYWWQAIEDAYALPDSELPKRQPHDGSIPPPKSWPQRNPDAADRWEIVRPLTVSIAEEIGIPTEILVQPDVIRRLCWEGFERNSGEQDIDALLLGEGVRPWQRELLNARIAAALHAA